MMLDATAGNRAMWNNKNPPNVVFIDKRLEDLMFSPHIQAVWKNLPFRSDVFDCVIFDPPHFIYKTHWKRSKDRQTYINYYGCWKNKREIIPTIFKALKEFHRVSKRLCFKWCDTRDGSTLYKLLPLFKGYWKEINRQNIPIKGRFGKRASYWVTFIRDSLLNAEDEKNV